MEDNSRDFGLFIDGLRIDRNLSREDLTDEIISLSQYKRYLRGAASIPNSILIQLADRLKFSISDIYLMYRSRSDNQYKKISNIYIKIKENKFKEAMELANRLRDEVILSDYNKLYFDFCYITIQHNLNMVSDIHVLGMYSNLIDYPKCSKNDSFNWVEINTLMSIVTISAKMENYEPSKIMYETMISDKFASSYSGDLNFLPVIYSNLAQILGIQAEYNSVVALTRKGIEYCKRYEISASLSKLFMFNALAYSDLNKMDEAKSSAKKAYMQLYIEGDSALIKHYSDRIEKRFEISIEELLKL